MQSKGVNPKAAIDEEKGAKDAKGDGEVAKLEKDVKAFFDVEAPGDMPEPKKPKQDRSTRACTCMQKYIA